MEDGWKALFGGPQQMSLGERAALEGILALIRPRLALEIGTAEGGSLRRIAAYSAEVHSFDLVAPAAEVAGLENVSFHAGDSHALLPELLAELSAAGRNVDFALVDGDHSAEGACRDIEDLLASPAIAKTLILAHDTANEEVRRGLDRVRYDEFEKVTHVDLDFVAGSLFREPELANELWGGIGILVVDAANPRAAGSPARQQRTHETGVLLRRAKRGADGPGAPRRLGAALRTRIRGR